MEGLKFIFSLPFSSKLLLLDDRLPTSVFPISLLFDMAGTTSPWESGAWLISISTDGTGWLAAGAASESPTSRAGRRPPAASFMAKRGSDKNELSESKVVVPLLGLVP